MGGIDMWIARDKDGDLFLHKAKPTKESDCWISVGLKESLIFGEYRNF